MFGGNNHCFGIGIYLKFFKINLDNVFVHTCYHFFLSFDRELKISLVVSGFLQIGNDYVQQASFSRR